MADKLVEEIKEVVVSTTIDPVAQAVGFTCCGWWVSLRKGETPKVPAPPTSEESSKDDSVKAVPSAPETV